MQMTTILYNNGAKVLEESFSSDERLQEWIENYPKYEILEIIHDTLD